MYHVTWSSLCGENEPQVSPSRFLLWGWTAENPPTRGGDMTPQAVLPPLSEQKEAPQSLQNDDSLTN